MSAPVVHTVVVAGGAGRRLTASAPDPATLPPKPLLSDGAGRRLIDRALAAAPRGGSVVVVGPPMPLPPHVHRVREDPPLSGPAAALAAGVAALGGG
ncbi:NTP transferase domain-containing protein, partial [Corynebacterium bovis]